MAALAVAAGAALALAVPATAGGASPTAGWSGANVVLPANAVTASPSAAFSSSCPAPGNCVVVGVYETTAGQSAVFADTQTAGAWSATQVPLPSNGGAHANPFPQSLDCPQVGSCTVVGRYTVASVHQEFAATLAAGSWSSQQLPSPPNPAATPGTTIIGAQCPAPGSCAVVGSYHAAGTKKAGLILTESGTTWTGLQAPLPANAAATPDPTLASVDCWAAGGCVAAGSYHGPTDNTYGMFETLGGGTWTVAATPLPSGGIPSNSLGLAAISCPGPEDCTAVGGFTDGADHTAGMAVTDDGGALSATATPVPANATTGMDSGSLVFSVSCPSTTWCAAGGIYATGGSPTGTVFLLELTGGTWKATQAPGLPANKTALATTISCSWPGSCSAAGYFLTAATKPTGFLETLVNGTWTEQNALGGAGSGTGSFFGTPESAGGGLSCVAGTCAAAGTTGITTPGGGHGFVDTYPSLDGYQEVASDGGLFAFGTPFFGSMGGMPLNQPIVAMAVKPDNGGYYEVASDGGIFAFGAPFHGSMGGKPLNEPIVGIAFDSLTGGYYEVASDGGIFAFTAPFHGSMGGKPLNAPIVGIAFDPDTGGYYEVASDGGIFAFTAPFHGSMGGKPLNKPIVGITVDTATGGYYEVASDGGLFAFTAPFHGSMGGQPLNEPIVGMAYDYVTGGYYEVASDGGLFAFTAPFNGSMGGQPLNKPVVGIAFG